MDSRDNPLYWSVPCGTWFMTQVRVSLLVPLILLGVCLQLRDWRLGALFVGVLCVTLIVHEFSHILAVRWTGGVGNEILIWPLGGLAFVQPAATFRSQFLTPAAGPLANLAVAALVAVPVWRGGFLPALLNPIRFPLAGIGDAPATDLVVLTFWTNWILFLANLLPVFPLDGIRMVMAVLKNRTDVESAAETGIRISLWVALLTMLGGLFAGSTWIVFLGAIVLFLSLFEWIQMRSGESLDDSFMGYDFSQGYTSLERSTRHDAPASRRKESWLAAWRQRRRAERDRRMRVEDEQAQQQLDAILEKVHVDGIASLSDAERRHLHRASARLRDRGKPSS